MPSHTAAIARRIPRRARASGPGPVRTGCVLEVVDFDFEVGFDFEVEVRVREDAPRLDDFFDEDRRVWLPDVRDRELLLFDTFLLRDLGGEDVRVAMMTRLGRYHTSLTRHTPIPGPFR
jgi:hypothetical protein